MHTLLELPDRVRELRSVGVCVCERVLEQVCDVVWRVGGVAGRARAVMSVRAAVHLNSAPNKTGITHDPQTHGHTHTHAIPETQHTHTRQVRGSRFS